MNPTMLNMVYWVRGKGPSTCITPPSTLILCQPFTYTVPSDPGKGRAYPCAQFLGEEPATQR